MKAPKKIHDILDAAVESGWHSRTTYNQTFSGEPFLNMTLFRPEDGYTIECTWHSRDTGSYRWWGAILNNRQTGASIAKVIETMQAN